jgi:hypothetical protein
LREIAEHADPSGLDRALLIPSEAASLLGIARDAWNLGSQRLVADGRSASKVHNVLMPVRVLCRHAIERDELLVNPPTNLRLPVATGRRERVASPQEAARLIEALPDEDRCLWWTAAQGCAVASYADSDGATSTSRPT